MTKQEATQRAQFADILAGEAHKAKGIVLDLPDYQRCRDIADLICRHGKTYARIQEMNCNGVGTWYGESNESFSKRQNRHEKWCEKREQQIEARITKLCAMLGKGFAPVFQGDPRGNTIKIKAPSGKTTDWAGEGIGVPTS